jgi:hypothetical protein
MSGFVCFHHADKHRRAMLEPESWFCMHAWFPDKGWLEFDVPRPLKKHHPNGHVFGRFNTRNKTNAQGAKRPPFKNGGRKPGAAWYGKKKR